MVVALGFKSAQVSMYKPYSRYGHVFKERQQKGENLKILEGKKRRVVGVGGVGL